VRVSHFRPFAPLLAASLLATAIGCGGDTAARRPAAWRYQTEEEWLVAETAESITALALHASGRPVDPLSISVRVEPGFRWMSKDATLEGPPRHRVHVQPVGRSFTITLPDHVWGPVGYDPLARALLRRAQRTPASTILPTESAFLDELTDLHVSMLAALNERVSQALEQRPLDPLAHDEAAFLVGALSLREAASFFGDIRRNMCRMTAQLAIADALRGDAQPGPVRRGADVLLLALVGRQQEALARLEGFAPAESSKAHQAWSRALRMRATNDWRPVLEPEKATLLERLEYVRARSVSVAESAVSEYLAQHPSESMTDWAHVALQRGLSVSVCGLFADSVIPADLEEFRRVRPAAGDLADWNQVVADLNAVPLPGGFQFRQGRPTLRAIDDGLWAGFFQRHLLFETLSVDDCYRVLWGFPEQAKAFEDGATKRFSGLRLYPLMAWRMAHDILHSRPAVEAGARLVASSPELVTPANWVPLHKPPWSEPPSEALWFAPALPYGTVFDTTRFYDLRHLPDLTVSARERFFELAPYDRATNWAHMTNRGGQNMRDSLEQLKAAEGPLAEYDLSVMERNLAMVKEKPRDYRRGLEDLCRVEATQCAGLAYHLVELGETADAVRYLEEFRRRCSDPVTIANNTYWLANFYYDHGRKEEAYRIAREAADTFSADGLFTLARLLERDGKFSEAADLLIAEEERYENRWPVVSLYVRNRRKLRGTKLEWRLEPYVKALFPDGLQPVGELKLKAPEDGARITGWDDRLGGARLKEGAIIVAADDVRVRNHEQFECFRSYGENRSLRITVWQDDAYRMVEVQGGPFGISLQTGPVEIKK